MRVAALQRSVAAAEAGSGTRHGFRAIVRDNNAAGNQPPSRDDASAPQLEGESVAAQQAERDALGAYVA